MNLSATLAAHLNAQKEEKDRDPARLYVSDMGKCPRMVAYRIQQTELDPVAEQSKVNKTIMFDLAERIEANLADALRAEGNLLGYQDGISLLPHENWGGRLDIVAMYKGSPRIIEVKTIHPNAFNHDIDYPQHHMQAAVYDIYYDWAGAQHDYPIVVYFDRGGQNTSIEQDCGYSRAEIESEMRKLEQAREYALRGDLPPKMKKELKLRSYGKQIVLEPNHQCAYCDYAMTCKPDTGKSVWAERPDNKSPFTAKKKADPEMLAEFAREMATEVLS